MKKVFNLKTLSFVVLTLSLFGFVGCGSGRQSVKKAESSKENLPNWVVKPPKEPGYVFFTGYGEGLSFDEAKQMAMNEAKQHIVEYINSEVTAVFKMEGFSTEESSFADIVNKIVSKGTANIQMPPPEDVYLEKSKDEGVEVYKVWVLVKYSKAVAEKERKRIENEVKQQLMSVDEFIEKGDKSLAEGRVLDAVNNYLRAALNSLNVPKRKAEYPQIVDKAKSVLKKVKMLKVSGDNQKGTVESGLKKPLVVKLVYRSSSGQRPVGNAVVLFKMKGSKGDYDKKDTTDNKGIARCFVRKIDKPSSRIKIKAYLDLDLSEFMSKKGQPYIDGIKLKEIAKKISVEFGFSARSSKAGTLVGVISVVDRSDSGFFVPDSTLSSIVQRILTEYGYKVKSYSVRVSSDSIDSKVSSLVNSLKAKNGKYLVMVQFSHSSPELKDVGGMKRYLVRGKVSLRVIDVASGDVVSADSFSVLRYGTTRNNAIDNIYKFISSKMEEVLRF